MVQKGDKEILNKLFIDNLRNENLRILVRGVVVQEGKPSTITFEMVVRCVKQCADNRWWTI